MSSAAAQYLREVNRKTVCPRSVKKPFLRQLGRETEYYCADHGDTTVEVLSEQFGSPEEVAGEFLSELGRRAVSRCVRARNRALCLALAAALGALVLAVNLGIRTYGLRQTLPAGEVIAAIIYDGAENGSALVPARDTIYDERGR